MKAFGYPNSSFSQSQSGYRNTSWPVMADGKQLNLILYKREAGITQIIDNARTAGTALAKAGLPARTPADERILKISSGKVTQLAGLYTYLPGTTIPWEAYTMDHLKLLGKTMGNMHVAWKNTDQTGYPLITDQMEQLIGRMEQYFARHGVQRAMQQKLKLQIKDGLFTTFHAFMADCSHLPNQQLLHMDFVRGNVLFETDHKPPKLTGIIDFEKVAVGHPLFDVARTLAFLLVDCKYKQPDKIRKYFLESGYHKRSTADLRLMSIKHNGASAEVLETLIDFFLIHDLYKFMLHNPYEHLDQNEHYVRTRDLLQERQLVV